MTRSVQSTSSEGSTSSTHDATEHITDQRTSRRIPKLILTKPECEDSTNLQDATTPKDESFTTAPQSSADVPQPERGHSVDAPEGTHSELDSFAEEPPAEQHRVDAEKPKGSPFLRRATTLWKPEKSIHAPPSSDDKAETV